MERKFAKRLLGLAVLLLSLALWAPVAFSWGSATNAFIGAFEETMAFVDGNLNSYDVWY